MVKAFNTIFRDVLAAGGPLDVFLAGFDRVSGAVAMPGRMPVKAVG